jgi:hypothetical protein
MAKYGPHHWRKIWGKNMKPKKSGIVEELKEKHKERLALTQIELKRQMARPETGSDRYISDILMFSKWAYRVGKGWYGFSLGDVPRVWTDVLDEFLCWLEIQCPDFENQQIKMKIGSVRVYVDPKTNDKALNEAVRAECWKLMDLLRMPQNLKNVKASRRVYEARKKQKNTTHTK